MAAGVWADSFGGDMPAGGSLFSALLRYWRGRRGLSQLALATEADVTPRHVSFLETGRAGPSAEMVLRLFSVLGAPLRAQNEALEAAGFAPRFATPAAEALAPEVELALAQMMRQHEPYPLTVLAPDGVILRSNRATPRVFRAFMLTPAAAPTPLDMYSLLFDPQLLRPFIVGWERFAHGVISRLHRERLQRGDARLEAVLERLFRYPGVPRSWRQPDFSREMSPTQRIELGRDELRASFLVAVTVLSAPQQVTLEELRIESCFPLDEATSALCARLAS
jgi:transcriptional regulator with XRE-family HTH domain